jgi:choline-sulfatase
MPTVLDLVGVPAESVLPIDGRSVVPLVRGERDPERTIFGEIHGGGVTSTCFMVRRGSLKYVHVTGHPAQLYDVCQDPREARNLSGDAAYAAAEGELHVALMGAFDPDAIERDVQASLARRRVVKEAMLKAGLPKWDYQPFFDATDRYWREG